MPVEELIELRHFAELGRSSAYLLHELSNPLTAALLHLELSNQRSRSVRQARRNLKLLHRYVEAARRQVRLQSSSCQFLIGPQIDQLKTVLLPLARRSGVRLNLTKPPDCSLYGDGVKFQQIISNLVSNAIEASADYTGPQGTVNVSWRIKASVLIVRVEDSGGGIAPEDLPRLFENFYSDKPSTGLGLGLGLVKLYVSRDFSGTIRVASTTGKGSIFYLRLPLADKEMYDI